MIHCNGGDRAPESTRGSCLSDFISGPVRPDGESNPRDRYMNAISVSGRLPMKDHPKATLATVGLTGPTGGTRNEERAAPSTPRNPSPGKAMQKGLHTRSSTPGVPRSTGIWPVSGEPVYNHRPFKRDSAHPLCGRNTRVLSPAALLNDEGYSTFGRRIAL